MPDNGTIVVCQTGKIGDILLTTPLFNQLRKIRPDSRLLVLCSPAGREVISGNPHIDEVKVYTKRILSDLSLIFSGLRSAGYWIDVKREFSRTSALFEQIFTPHTSLGYNSGSRNNYDVDLTQYVKGEHATDISLAPVGFFAPDFTAVSNRPEIFVPDLMLTEAGKKMRSREKPGVLFNISAGKEGRKLKEQTWVDAIREVNAASEFRPFLISAPSDAELARRISAEANAERLQTDTIHEAAALVKEAAAVITPDTSIVHMCSAFNTPVVAVYPDVDWNLRRFCPMSDLQEVIVSDSEFTVETVKPQIITEAFLRLAESIA